MIFFTSLLIYSLLIIFIRIKPIYLRERKPSYKDNFLSIKGTFILGFAMICIFGATSGFTMSNTSHITLLEWGLNKDSVFQGKLHLLITNNFIHINAFHLYSNIVGLLILSPYEKKVGTLRFITIFLFSGILSSIARLYIGSPLVSAGASAGLYGIIAAYFLDIENIWQKNWKRALLIFSIFIAFMLFISNYANTYSIDVDNWAHALGSAAAIIYIRINPLKPSPKKNNKDDNYNFFYNHYCNDNSNNDTEEIIGISSALICITFCTIIFVSSGSDASSNTYLTKIMHSKFANLKKIEPKCNFEQLKIDSKVGLKACSALADKGNSDALYVIAEVFHLSNQPKISRQLFYNSALRGNPDGLYRYGYYLEYGKGGEKDLKRSKISYKKAAELGNPVAQLKVAEMPETSKQEAKQLYLKAKEKNVFNWKSLFAIKDTINQNKVTKVKEQ